MSQYTIPLAGYMTKCPSCWVNFFNQELAAGPRDKNGDVTPDWINQKVSKYRARYIVDKTYWGLLEFESEQDILFFKLKFS